MIQRMYWRLITIVVISTILQAACQNSGAEQTPGREDVYLRDELSIQSGLESFNVYCAPCHNFDEEGIGPNLTGITTEVDKAWLVKFIRNAPLMIEEGDTRATELFEKYKQPMPPFAMLGDEKIEHLLAFIHRFSEGQKRIINDRPGGLINPVESKIPMSGLTLVLEEVLTFPPSAISSPLARINKLQSVKFQKKERMFVHDLRGPLYEIVDNQPLLYLDIAEVMPNFIDNPGWGTGLGSFDFHPMFEKNGLFYTSHTEPKNSAPADFALADSIEVTLQWVLLEWKTDDTKANQFKGTHRELLRADMRTGAHGFQEITFNPLSRTGDSDFGMLYIGVGDSALGLRGYPELCDNPGTIWGAVLRIDPTGKNASNGNYGIPGDNPFVGQSGALGEVWAYGFRNPHRISWDLTGSQKMFISNIGQHSVEEINLGQPGGNYGWPKREGTFLFDVLANPELVYPLPEVDTGFVYPVAQYDHDEGNAVSGGYVYSGTIIPQLQGKYIFGDIPRGFLFYSEVSEMIQGKQAPVYKLNVEMNGQKTDLKTVTNDIRVNLRLGTDLSGELYLFTKSNGNLYKVVDCKTDAEELINDN